jgi:hypothetical protein
MCRLKARSAAGLLFMCAASYLHGLPAITGVTAEFDIKPEFNRTFRQCWTFAVQGSAEFNNWLTTSAGIALWTSEYVSELDCFLKGEAALPFGIPLYADLSYIYNVMPEYETQSHSLLPALAIRNRWLGFTLGLNFRFTSFLGEPPVFESMLVYSGFVNFVNTGNISAGIECSNYDNFHAGNAGAYFLSLNGRFAVNRKLAFISRFEIRQSGSIGLTATLDGVALKAGVLFAW